MDYNIVSISVFFGIAFCTIFLIFYWCISNIIGINQRNLSGDDLEIGMPEIVMPNWEVERRANLYFEEIEKLSEDKFESGQECCICMDENIKSFVIPKYCKHKKDAKYCKKCLIQHAIYCLKVQTDFLCPVCRECIVIEDSVSATEYSYSETDSIFEEYDFIENLSEDGDHD